MKFLNGKWAFAILGALLGAAIVAGIHYYGTTAGLFGALNTAGSFIGHEIAGDVAKNEPALDVPLAILLGIFVGAILGALATGSYKADFHVDGNFFAALLRNLFGGFLVMTGVLIATETIWGELSGSAMLSESSWIFLGAMIATGVLFSRITGGKSGASAKATKKAPAKAAKKGAAK